MLFIIDDIGKICYRRNVKRYSGMANADKNRDPG